MDKDSTKKQTRKRYHGEALDAVAAKFGITRTYASKIMNGVYDYAHAKELRQAYRESVRQFEALKRELSKKSPLIK